MFADYKSLASESNRSSLGKQQLTSKTTVDEVREISKLYNKWEPEWFPQNIKIKSLVEICPICGQFVYEIHLQQMFKSPSCKYYLIHATCKNGFSQFTQFQYKAIKMAQFPMFGKPIFSIGTNQYWLRFSLGHPISNTKFLQIEKKLLEYKNNLFYNTDDEQSQVFTEKILAVPLKQFKCTIDIESLSRQNHQIHSLLFTIDLDDQEMGRQYYRCQQQNVIFQCQLEVVIDNERKRQLIDLMNRKYDRPYQIQEFVVIHRFTIEFLRSQCFLNPEDEIFLEKQPCNRSISLNNQYEKKQQTQTCETLSQQTQKNHSPIYSNFVESIKTQAGSKQFQKLSKSYSQEQIDSVIDQINPYIEQIVLDKHGNYMIQSLLRVCQFKQRKFIMQNIGKNTALVMCKQQGTFVFQQFMSVITLQEEYEIICKYIAQDFKKIALDNYGVHSLRKLLQKMPCNQIFHFLPSIFENFIEFSSNRNAVFIVKEALKNLVKLEAQNNSTSSDLNEFLEILGSHIQKLIYDQFGNYLVQQALKSVDNGRIKIVIDYIIKYFTNCSVSKFSTNVVLGCVKTFWYNYPSYFERLANCLSQKNIRTIFQNKQGNRILSAVMELDYDIELQYKIINTYKNGQLPKNVHKKWYQYLDKRKSKTGSVGTNYISFSEALGFGQTKHQH